MTVALEPGRVEEKNDQPLISHLSVDPARRTALCGAAILGIEAFGDFDRCEDCGQLWGERFS